MLTGGAQPSSTSFSTIAIQGICGGLFAGFMRSSYGSLANFSLSPRLSMKVFFAATWA
ncbi:hypothetical protein C8D78_0112 [Arthrobacter oryzae]|uniref:Uncharacterized protein n=1 Tax=Arthrobacter oryzae TaxID=409290 RepID=A0A495FM56_9MICC|nr:hypothetical protein C8D78_0112 [Arthrobacter oryzae]